MTDIDKILAAVLGKEPDPDAKSDVTPHGAKKMKKTAAKPSVREGEAENKDEIGRAHV